MMNEAGSIKSLETYLERSTGEYEAFVEAIDYQAVIKAKQLILEAQQRHGRVHVTGVGKPAHVAGYIASLLSSTGTPAYELHATEAVHGSSGQVLAGDVVIAISNSGETKELQATVQTVKANGARIIAVTGNRNSYLAGNADVVLHAGVTQEGDVLNKPPRTSILAEIAVLQVLSVALQYEYNLTPADYVRWHPGGALGESIREGLL